MTVFISWSGAESKHVASALREWLPQIVQGLDVFMSDEDIPAGTRWFAEIGGRLEEAEFGVICVTPDNLEKPWLNFEAGAIGKQAGDSRVVPFTISLSRNEVTGPLLGFNAVNSDREGFMSLITSIHEALRLAVPLTTILRTADTYWADVEGALDARPKGETSPPRFNADEAIREIRDTVRQLARDQTGSPSVASPTVGQTSVLEVTAELLARRDRQDAVDKFLNERGITLRGPAPRGKAIDYVRAFDASRAQEETTPSVTGFVTQNAIRGALAELSERGDKIAMAALELLGDDGPGGVEASLRLRFPDRNW